MLADYNPQGYGIWNDKVKEAFMKLGITIALANKFSVAS